MTSICYNEAGPLFSDDRLCGGIRLLPDREQISFQRKSSISIWLSNVKKGGAEWIEGNKKPVWIINSARCCEIKKQNRLVLYVLKETSKNCSSV